MSIDWPMVIVIATIAIYTLAIIGKDRKQRGED